MSEETANEQKTTNETANEPAPEQTPAVEPSAPVSEAEGATGRNFTDFKDPKDEARFKRIYGHMKEYERVNTQLVEDNKRLFDRLNHIEAAGNQTAVNSQLTRLREAKKSALEAQDVDRVMQIDEQIMDIKATAIKKPEPIAPVAQAPLATGGMPHDWGEKFVDWASELNNSGDYVRPWAANQNHPLHLKAVRIASDILADSRYADDIDAVFTEVERRMQSFKPGPAAVLASDRNVSGGSAKKIALTDVQKRVAKAMGLTDDDYIKGMTA